MRAVVPSDCATGGRGAAKRSDPLLLSYGVPAAWVGLSNSFELYLATFGPSETMSITSRS
jgi:hypothetical protein